MKTETRIPALVIPVEDSDDTDAIAITVDPVVARYAGMAAAAGMAFAAQMADSGGIWEVTRVTAGKPMHIFMEGGFTLCETEAGIEYGYVVRYPLSAK